MSQNLSQIFCLFFGPLFHIKFNLCHTFNFMLINTSSKNIILNYLKLINSIICLIVYISL